MTLKPSCAIKAHPSLTESSEEDKEDETGGSDDRHKHNARILALKKTQITTNYAAKLTSCKISFIKSLVV